MPATRLAGSALRPGIARGGMWTEGTELAALFMKLSGQEAGGRRLTKAAQTMRMPGGSYLAAGTKQLQTGLRLDTDPSQSRQYFHLAHLAPLFWAAMPERRYNPFTGKSALP
ncbi:MAG: hypothetical protein ACREHV_07705 [Rhizomicrobium sp.]